MNDMMSTDTFDHLRIIAKDARGLDAFDRDAIKGAADEMEYLYRLLSETQAQLIESQAHRIALNEQLLATRHREAELMTKLKMHAPTLRMTMSTGWLKITETKP